jgi:hypothetical protein
MKFSDVNIKLKALGYLRQDYVGNDGLPVRSYFFKKENYKLFLTMSAIYIHHADFIYDHTYNNFYKFSFILDEPTIAAKILYGVYESE